MKLLVLSFLPLASLALLACSGSSTGVGTGPAGSTGTSSGAADPSPAPTSSTTDDPRSTGDSGPTPASAGDLVVFTTKATFDGDLGGVTGADTKCTTYANAAGLPGKYRAWLSSAAGGDALSRVPEGGPWRLRDPQAGLAGPAVFADRQSWAGYPAHAINRDEFGNPLQGYGYVWTGTGIGGLRVDACSCGDWKSNSSYACDSYGGSAPTYGNSNLGYGDEGWTNVSHQGSCYSEYALVCYQL
ncbi:MAG: Tryptophan synthase alpha chain [Labilithrix sp.]|nr:Tryptophan synthase alpha chain [Labilithrix sp.]